MTSPKHPSPNRPGVAVIIIGWNNLDLLDDCFASIYAQTYKHITTIYVDNGSKDASVAHVKKHHPKVVIMDTKHNNGFSVGNNLGIARALEDASCGYIVALNSDARLAPEWTQTLVDFAKANPDAACLQGLTLMHPDHSRLDSAGIYMDLSGAPLQLGYGEPNKGWKSGEVFGVNAAAALYTRSFLESQPFGNDYFDHDLFMYYEDVDLSARAMGVGMKNYMIKEAVAYHMGSASSGGNPTFMLRMVHRNLPLVMIKNLPLRVIVRCLPGLTSAEFKRFKTFIRERRYGLAKAMLVGRLSGLYLLPLFIWKRSRLRPGRATSVKHYYELMQPGR